MGWVVTASGMPPHPLKALAVPTTVTGYSLPALVSVVAPDAGRPRLMPYGVTTISEALVAHRPLSRCALSPHGTEVSSTMRSVLVDRSPTGWRTEVVPTR